MSNSLFALLFFWVSSSMATRPLPLPVTWYSPMSARSPISGNSNDDSNSDESMSVVGPNPDATDLMGKSTSILYGDQPPLTSLRLNKMVDDQWLRNTLEPDMEFTQADTDTNPDTEQQSPMMPEPREMATLFSLEKARSKKRGDGHSLSVVNPVDVLRQRMLMEAARERMRQNQDQIEANAQLLKEIGKRQSWSQQSPWFRAWDADKVDMETSRTQAS